MRKALFIICLLVPSLAFGQFTLTGKRIKHKQNDLIHGGSETAITGTWNCTNGSVTCTAVAGGATEQAQTDLADGDVIYIAGTGTIDSYVVNGEPPSQSAITITNPHPNTAVELGFDGTATAVTIYKMNTGFPDGTAITLYGGNAVQLPIKLADYDLDEATGNEIAFEIPYETNKATSGNDTGLKITWTDTASPGSSWPLAVYGGANSLFDVSGDGSARMGGGYGATGATLSGATGNLSIDGALQSDGNITFGDGSAGVDFTLTANGETADGVLTYMEDEDRWDFAEDVLIAGSTNLLTLGNGAAGVDYTITIDGETDDCTLTWDEDNGYLGLSDGDDFVAQYLRSTGADWMIQDALGFVLASDHDMYWSSTTAATGARDVNFARSAAGWISVDDGGGDAVGDGSIQATEHKNMDGLLTGGTGVAESADGYLETAVWKGVFDYSDIATQCGAVQDCDYTVLTLPAKTLVQHALFVVETQGAISGALVGTVGDTTAAYEDWIDGGVTCDMEGASGTVYGDTDAERGANLPTAADMLAYLPSYTGTTAVKVQIHADTVNLNDASHTAGSYALIVVYTVLP